MPDRVIWSAPIVLDIQASSFKFRLTLVHFHVSDTKGADSDATQKLEFCILKDQPGDPMEWTLYLSGNIVKARIPLMTVGAPS